MVQPSVTYELTWPVKINVQRTHLSEEQFALLCQENPELRLELTAQGKLIIMPPTGSESGWRSGEIFLSLGIWAKQDGTVLSFDSSKGESKLRLFPKGASTVSLPLLAFFQPGEGTFKSLIQRKNPW